MPVSCAPSLERLRCGTYLAPSVLPVFEAAADEAARRLVTETESVVETDHENCARDVNDVCFVYSLA